MNLRVAVAGEVKSHESRIRSESESEQGVQSSAADAKPGDLRMTRMKSREHGMEVRTNKR